MKRKLLIVLLSTILCTSCDYEPLFFKTNKKATLEEVESFIDNIHSYETFIPDGWYEYKMVVNIDGKEGMNDHYYFHIKNEKTEDNVEHFNITHLIGVSHRFYTYNYYCNENILITETIHPNGKIERTGSDSVRFRFGGSPFIFNKQTNLKNNFEYIEYYIKNN